MKLSSTGPIKCLFYLRLHSFNRIIKNENIEKLKNNLGLKESLEDV